MEGGGDVYDVGEAKADGGQGERINPTPFTFKPYHLASLLDPKNLKTFKIVGETNYLLAGLRTVKLGRNPPMKLLASPVPSRGKQRVCGPNALPVRNTQSLLEFIWLALKDTVLVGPGSVSRQLVRSQTSPADPHPRLLLSERLHTACLPATGYLMRCSLRFGNMAERHIR